jgi:4-diphosphocytidyl-2-C-methyl-D-erythritol kinase
MNMESPDKGKMIKYKAYAKVNLALEVLGLRPDGYHEVQTVLQTVSLADELTFQLAEGLSVSSDHPAVPGDERNLVFRAGRALQQKFGLRQGARVAIKKRIPVGGGLGGGSSDAACALVAMSRLWGLSPSFDELEEIAGTLGSDVPFFLRGGTCLAKGRGELLEPLPPLPPCFLALAFPGFGVSTAWAYKNLKDQGSWALTKEGECIKIVVSFLESGNLQGIARSLFNRFEEAVFPAHPELANLKQALLRAGSEGALLSGSGSTVFGLFGKRKEMKALVAELKAVIPSSKSAGLKVEMVQPVEQVWGEGSRSF